MSKKEFKITLASLIGVLLLSGAACYRGDHIHTFSDTWSHDETNHWHEATCGHNVRSDNAPHSFVDTVVDPDYENRGYTVHRCSICEYEFIDTYVDPLNHHFSDAWTSDDTYHWKQCIDEGYEYLTNDRAEHTFGHWTYDSYATSSLEGHRHRNCDVCNYREDETFVLTQRVYFSTSAISMFKGLNYTLTPVVLPNNALKNIKYEIANQNILSIVNDVAYGDELGQTTVLAYNDNDNDNVRDDDEPYTILAFAITESDPTISVNVTPSIVLNVGETKALEVSVTGASPYGFDYGYFSENEEICTASGGYIKGHKAGTTRVSVSWKGYRGYCNVRVNDLYDTHGLRASSLNVKEETIVVNKGEYANIEYSIEPASAIDTISQFETSNNLVAGVDNTGTVYGEDAGNAVITLKTTNNKIARVLVIVKDPQNDSTNYYNNYYGDLTWENGADLMQKLHNIISADVNPLSYTKSSTNNWVSNQNADLDLYDHAYVNPVYSDNLILKTNTNTGWQREHAFAASLMTGYGTGVAVTSLGRATDFHNLFAAHAGANGSRGNDNFGYTNREQLGYNTKENCSYRKNTWEPADNDKGRLARAIFYMSVMYNVPVSTTVKEKWTFRGEDITSHENATKTITLSTTELPIRIIEDEVGYNKIKLDDFMLPDADSPHVSTLVEYYRDLVRAESPELEGSDYDLFRQKAYEKYTDASMAYSIGHLSDLLKWNAKEVDYSEMQHNNSVYLFDTGTFGGAQGNRNPFVDYPQLVDYVFGALQDQPGRLKDLIPSYLRLDMNVDELHHYAYDSSTEVSYAVGESPSLADFPIKAIKNDLSEGVVDPSRVSIDDYTFVEADVANGKYITIHTDLNDINVHVTVTSQSLVRFDDCTYHFKATSGLNNSDCFNGSETSYTLKLGDEKYDVTLGTATTYIRNIGDGGITIGSGTSSITSLTMVSQNSFNNVNAVYFYGAPSTGVTVTVKIYVNDVEVYSVQTDGTSNIKEYGGMFAAASGKVKIVVNTPSGIKVAGMAINYQND